MGFVEIPAISIVLCFFLGYLALGAAATHYGASGSVVVIGNVFCDACLEGRPSKNDYVISGASVAVECRLNRKTLTVSIITGETDENGEFKVELPSNIFHSADTLNKCSVKPLRSPYDFCRIPSKSAPSSLTLQSESNGVVTYNAGSMSYRHETLPASCYRKDFLRMIKGRAVAENFDESSKAAQQIPTIPLLPKLPLRTLPNHPPLTNFGIAPLPQISPLPSILPLPIIPPLPPLPTIPPLPKTPPLPPLPTTPPLPKIPPLPPLPTIPPLPKTPPLAPLPTTPPLPKIPPLPPLPTIPPLPRAPPPAPLPTIPPLPKIPPLPPLPTIPPLPLPTIPPLPKIPPLPPHTFPPSPQKTIPALPPLAQIP